MNTPSLLPTTIARLSLCFAPLCPVACLEDAAELAVLSDDLDLDDEQAEPVDMDMKDLVGSPSTQRAPDGQKATSIELTQYSDARCNDGSVPVVWYDLDPDGGTNWLVYLQGGGACNSFDSCEDRWKDCHGSKADPEDKTGWHGNMTADDATKKNFDGDGILDFDGHAGEPSPFAGKGFNRVFVPYCSSDHWRGLGGTQAVDPAYAPACGSPEGLTSIYFGGGKIVEAVIDGLMDHARAPQDGDFVVLAGGSAGGGGVQHNLDRVADQVQADEPGVTVVGIADSAHGVGLDQDGIPDASTLENELYWGGMDPAAPHIPGDPIDVVVDESCWSSEPLGAKDYCHESYYVVPNHMDSPIMVTSNTFDNVHEAAFEDLYDKITDCGGFNHHTGGTDPDLDALYMEYCVLGGDAAADLETWMRYQIGVDGTAILDTVPGVAYFIAHSSVDLHDKLLKHSDSFYRRARDLVPLNDIGGYEFAGLGGWTSTSGQNSNPSVASTVACALGQLGLPGSPGCNLHDVRVTSDLPTQVPVIEHVF